MHSHLTERLAENERALLRSQSGPMAGMALSASPYPTFSGWSCCAVSVFLSPSLCVRVVVAVFSTLAIIELRVPELGRWRRVLQSRDSCGRTHTIVQGEGGEQGCNDAVALLLGQHSALAAVQAQMESSVGFPRCYTHRHDAGTGWRSSHTT